MRNKILLMIFIVLSIISLGETRSVYVLVPSDLNSDDVKVSVIMKDGNKKFTETSDEVDASYSNKYDAYGATKYLEVKIDGLTSTDEAKYMIGYPSGEENGIPRYTIVASESILNNDDIQKAFDGPSGTGVDGIDALEMMDFGEIDSYNSYDTFPGKELTTEDSVVSGFVIGNKKYTSSEDESDDDSEGVNSDPSNIVEIYYKTDPNSPYNQIDGGAGISPTASDKNSEFELWAIQVYPENNSDPFYTNNNITYDKDKVGTPVYQTKIEDGVEVKIQRTDSEGNLVFFEEVDGTKVALYEPEKVLIYTSKDTTEKIILGGDFRSIDFIDGDKAFPTDVLDGAITTAISKGSETDEEKANGIRYEEDWVGFSEYKFDVRVRFKNANGETLDINGEPVELDSGSGNDKYKWQFYEVDDVDLYFHGGQKFTFNLEGNQTIIIPGDGIDVPDPIAQKIYVMTDDGKLLEGDAGITSAYQNTTKTRKTNVTMKVMTESGVTEKNYVIEDIEE